jgi:hypothetical protein
MFTEPTVSVKSGMFPCLPSQSRHLDAAALFLGLAPAFAAHSTTPRFLWDLGTFGYFGISASLVVQLREILTEPSVSWKYELLYVPFLIPFVLASAITIMVHKKDLEVPWWTPFTEAFERVAGTCTADEARLQQKHLTGATWW